jgi:endonuclease YncB( thermonuclease family)
MRLPLTRAWRTATALTLAAALATGCAIAPEPAALPDTGQSAAPLTPGPQAPDEPSPEGSAPPAPELAPEPEPDPPAPDLALPDTGGWLPVPAGAQPGVIERVVDGDTVWVRPTGDGPLPTNASHSIRLLLIDTPETVHPSKPVECGGPEASRFASELLAPGTKVLLAADQGDTDRYGRFLRYLWTADGVFYNQAVVAAGLAEVVYYAPNGQHLDFLRQVERDARTAGAGLWGEIDCDTPPSAGASAPPASGPTSGTGLSAAGNPLVVFTNCDQLRQTYRAGVARAGVSGNTITRNGQQVIEAFGTPPVIDDELYELNRARDGDKDGVACE